jgi:glycosyltransferase involved in cell wall biosynthesis
MTSDFVYDQRMQKIADVACNNFKVLIFHNGQNEKVNNVFSIKPLPRNGVLFYLLLNIKLFFSLIKFKADVYYAVDTDTLLGCGLARIFTKSNLIFDSHELFDLVPELQSSKLKQKIWNLVEKKFAKNADLALTVNDSLSQILSTKHGIIFHSIKNLPRAINLVQDLQPRENIILYQGAINKGRGIECAIVAMSHLHDYKLYIIGDGPELVNIKSLAASSVYEDRIVFINKITPANLIALTVKAKFGLNLLDGTYPNYYFSLANKFFDYWQAGVPSINMNFPEYVTIIQKHKHAIGLDELNPAALVGAIQHYGQPENYHKLLINTINTRNLYLWDEEAVKLDKLLSKFAS